MKTRSVAAARYMYFRGMRCVTNCEELGVILMLPLLPSIDCLAATLIATEPNCTGPGLDYTGFSGQIVTNAPLIPPLQVSLDCSFYRKFSTSIRSLCQLPT